MRRGFKRKCENARRENRRMLEAREMEVGRCAGRCGCVVRPVFGRRRNALSDCRRENETFASPIVGWSGSGRNCSGIRNSARRRRSRESLAARLARLARFDSQSVLSPRRVWSVTCRSTALNPPDFRNRPNSSASVVSAFLDF